MATFINPFTDFGFKRIFGQEEHKSILIGFLNALFTGELVVKDLVYRDKEQTGECAQNRTVIYDIYCTLDDGSHVIVEMQNKKEAHFDARALYYASRSIVAQGQKGDDWDYEYAPVIGVYFLNFLQDGLGRALRSDFGITKTKEVFAHTATESDKPNAKPLEIVKELPFAKKLRMVFLQMPEFTKKESECTTDLDKWAFIMNHMEKLTNIPWAAQDELYNELSKVSNVAALSPQERAIYDETLRQYRDNLATIKTAYDDGWKEGKEEGKEEGREEGREEIARSLLSANLPDEFVSQHTGLSIEKIKKMRIEK